MKTDSLTVTAPKLVLVPFIRPLRWDRVALMFCNIKQPHSIRGSTVLMTEQDEVAILWIDMDVIDPELLFAKYFFCLP